MTPPVLTPTADDFAHLTGPTWDRRVLPKSWTLLTTLGIPQEVSHTLGAWGSTILEPQLPAATEDPAMPYPATEVEAIELIARVLDLPRVDVLKAVRIPKRTFHGWKGKGHRPREKAKQRVWAMTAVVVDMAAFHENVAAWFHATPEVAEAFGSGDPDRLAMSELEWSSRNLKASLPPVVQLGDGLELPESSGTVAGFVSDDLEDQLASQHSDPQ